MAKKKEFMPYSNKIVVPQQVDTIMNKQKKSWFSWLFAPAPVKNNAYVGLKHAVNNPGTLRIKRNANTIRAISHVRLDDGVKRNENKLKAEKYRNERLLSQVAKIKIAGVRTMTTKSKYVLSLYVPSAQDAILLGNFRGRCLNNICFDSAGDSVFHLSVSRNAAVSQEAQKRIKSNYGVRRREIRGNSIWNYAKRNEKMTALNIEEKKALENIEVESTSRAVLPSGIVKAVWMSKEAMCPTGTHANILHGNIVLINLELLDNLVFWYYSTMTRPDTRLVAFMQNIDRVHSVLRDLRRFFTLPAVVTELRSKCEINWL